MVVNAYGIVVEVLENIKEVPKELVGEVVKHLNADVVLENIGRAVKLSNVGEIY